MTLSFFYPATLLPHKNHHIFLDRSISSFCERNHISIFFTIDSDNPLSSFSSSYHCLGRLTHTQCLSHLSQSSALLFVSSFESLGLPIIEASHFGIPTIAPDLPYVKELIGHHYYSFSLDCVFSLVSAFNTFLLDYAL